MRINAFTGHPVYSRKPSISASAEPFRVFERVDYEPIRIIVQPMPVGRLAFLLKFAVESKC